MPRRTSTPETAEELDATSAVPVLHYVGDPDAHPGEVPARDLSASDLARIVYQRRVTALDPVRDGATRPSTEVTHDEMAAVGVELLRSERWSTEFPEPEPEDAPAVETGDAPEKGPDA